MCMSSLPECGANEPRSGPKGSLVSLIVCDVQNEDDITGNCNRCARMAMLADHLSYTCPFYQDLTESVTYQQWVSGKCCRLETLNLPAKDFKERLAEVITELAEHHYINRSLAEYFCDLEAHLTGAGVIVIMDFAANYSYIV